MINKRRETNSSLTELEAAITVLLTFPRQATVYSACVVSSGVCISNCVCRSSSAAQAVEGSVVSVLSV